MIPANANSTICLNDQNGPSLGVGWGRRCRRGSGHVPDGREKDAARAGRPVWLRPHLLVQPLPARLGLSLLTPHQLCWVLSSVSFLDSQPAMSQCPCHSPHPAGMNAILQACFSSGISTHLSLQTARGREKTAMEGPKFR